MAFTRRKTAPTGYDRVRVLFHGIRTAQLISSIIVSSINCFFIWWIVHDHESTPWTFVVLTTTSFLTMICLTATIILHLLSGLNPRFNLVLNSLMLVLWALGFAMLSYWAFGTLTHACSVSLWQTNDGMMVCRCYKALYAFSATGVASTIAALGLDIHIYRLAVRFGQHMRLDNETAANEAKSRTVVDAREPMREQHQHQHYNDEEQDGDVSTAYRGYDTPRVVIGAFKDDDEAVKGKLLAGEEEREYKGNFNKEEDTAYYGVAK